MVAGAGFEPHDLRVMSPTSYQAAPPRDISAFARKCASRQGALLFYIKRSVLSTVFRCFFKLFLTFSNFYCFSPQVDLKVCAALCLFSSFFAKNLLKLHFLRVGASNFPKNLLFCVRFAIIGI